ncbi:MAG: oligosaccharide flippase family protein, partial [Clostridiales bacterium]|nr:oligosaccharide flippase family protein [Clostridiales bacterium]
VELIGYSALHFIQVFRGKTFYSKKFWGYAVRFNLPLIPHYLSQTVLNSADRIMINSMIGSDKAGIYSLAYSISLIMTLFNTALSQTLSPWLYQKIKDKKETEIATLAYTTLLLIACVNLLLIGLAPEVVAIFAPESYYEAIWIIPPVAMSVYFMYSYDLFAKFAFYYEKTNFIMAASVIGAVLNIVLNYYFIPVFGYIAAGYTTLVCYIFYCVGHYFFMCKICDKFCDGVRPYEIKKILAITIPFLAGGFLMLFTYNHIVVRYAVLAVALMLIVVNRKKIIGAVKNILAVRNKRN